MHRSAVLGLVLVISVVAVSVSAVRAHDPTRLPLGDGRVSGAPKVGYVYSCQQQFRQRPGEARVETPWIRGGSWDSVNKPVVRGQVPWPDARISVAVEGAERVIRGNSLPNHTTGRFPIARTDPAYQYDRNPNTIRAGEVLRRLPAAPTIAGRPTCVPMGAVGIALTGAHIFNALDAEGRDAPAHEIQDRCSGHPQERGQYHYHSLSDCMDDPAADQGRHSDLVGYGLDGFGIYGLYGDGGREIVNEDLDSCHGHLGEVRWDGAVREIYHYHLTREYPYTIGCFRGTPVSTGAERRGGMPSAFGRPAQRRGNRGLGAPGSAGPPGPGGGRDPLAAVAEELGLDPEALRRAVGPPPPDIARASRLLGIDEATLRQTFERHRPR